LGNKKEKNKAGRKSKKYRAQIIPKLFQRQNEPIHN